MCWEDFQKHFQNIDVCHRSKGIDDLRLDINEDAGCIGPTKGCVGGLCEYYCACKGCVALCCPTDHTVATLAELKLQHAEEEEKATAQP